MSRLKRRFPCGHDPWFVTRARTMRRRHRRIPRRGCLCRPVLTRPRCIGAGHPSYGEAARATPDDALSPSLTRYLRRKHGCAERPVWSGFATFETQPRVGESRMTTVPVRELTLSTHQRHSNPRVRRRKAVARLPIESRSSLSHSYPQGHARRGRREVPEPPLSTPRTRLNSAWWLADTP